MDMYNKGIKARDIITKDAIMNALTVDMALGCSTNSMLHLPAIAHEIGFDFDISFANPISERTPNLCHLAPAGPTYMEDLNEAGGVNSMLPIAAAARLNMPMVDVDGMGRAFPELQMVTFTIGGIKATPMALVDEKGNSCIFETITNKWTEELARSVTMSCGASVSVSLYPMSGKQMKEFGVHGIVTRSQQLGKAIRTVKDCGDQTPEEHFLEMSEGFKLFKGKIADVLRETRAGFNLGKGVREGIGEYKGHTAYVEFQNENLTATVDGKILATTPDLISLVDTETYIPVTTDGLKYGKRVMVVGLKCFHLWRTEKGIELVGPRYFGVDTDYIPLEERCKGGN